MFLGIIRTLQKVMTTLKKIVFLRYSGFKVLDLVPFFTWSFYVQKIHSQWIFVFWTWKFGRKYFGHWRIKKYFFRKISAAWRRNFAATCENYVLAKILLVWSGTIFYKETTTCNHVAMTYINHKKSFKKIPFIKILKNRF